MASNAARFACAQPPCMRVLRHPWDMGKTSPGPLGPTLTPTPSHEPSHDAQESWPLPCSNPSGALHPTVGRTAGCNDLPRAPTQ